MITCPKCGELNGNNATECYKCHAHFPKQAAYKKRCPKCGVEYSSRAEECEDCHCRLVVVTDHEPVAQEQHTSTAWAFWLTALIPLVGIIVGAIWAAQGDYDRASTGKKLIVFAICWSALVGIIWYCCTSCAVHALL